MLFLRFSPTFESKRFCVWRIFSLVSFWSTLRKPGSINRDFNVPVNSKTAPAPPPPLANPWAFDFLEKFWSNSPLCCQFRRSNAPPVRASKRVKSPTLQECEANCGIKLCKIFSHYEFLVQLAFAPQFKQRHIPR